MELITKKMPNDFAVQLLDDSGTDYVLRCMQGIYKGMFVYINLTENGEIIGSSVHDCTLCLDDCDLLPKHCQIKYGINNNDQKKGGYYLKSFGETWLKIRYDCPAIIHDGMEIKIGNLTYIVKAQNDNFSEITEWLYMNDL